MRRSSTRCTGFRFRPRVAALLKQRRAFLQNALRRSTWRLLLLVPLAVGLIFYGLGTKAPVWAFFGLALTLLLLVKAGALVMWHSA